MRTFVVFRQAPYGTSYTGEGIRMVSSFGAFEMETSLAFVDDGVIALVKNQDPQKLQMKSLSKVFEGLSGVVDEFLVSSRSLEERGIRKEELIEGATVIDDEEIRRKMDQCDVILTF